ncbi:unnamed protein product [Ascophyllum nodosum]
MVFMPGRRLRSASSQQVAEREHIHWWRDDHRAARHAAPNHERTVQQQNICSELTTGMGTPHLNIISVSRTR